MDRDKDIGPICDLYSNKDEVISNKETITDKGNKINDIESSITASLINNNINKKIFSDLFSERLKIFLQIFTVFLIATLIVFGIYYLISNYY